MHPNRFSARNVTSYHDPKSYHSEIRKLSLKCNNLQKELECCKDKQAFTHQLNVGAFHHIRLLTMRIMSLQADSQQKQDMLAQKNSLIFQLQTLLASQQYYLKQEESLLPFVRDMATQTAISNEKDNDQLVKELTHLLLCEIKTPADLPNDNNDQLVEELTCLLLKN